MTRAVLAVTVLLSLAARAPAAAWQDEMISMELVERLFGGPALDVSVDDDRPQDFPSELVPDGAVVRIGMSNPHMSMVVAEAPAFTSADVPRYERKIAAAGWRTIEGPAGQRGLATSPAAPTMTCRGTQQMSYSTEPRREGGFWIHIRVSEFGGMPCGGTSPGASPGRPYSVFDDERMPRLTVPAGSRVDSMSSGGSSDHQEQHVSLETRMSVAEVAKHYATQAIAHGWKSEAEASADGIAIVRFAAPLGDDNREVPVIVSAMTLPGDRVVVTLRVLSERPRR